MLIIENAHVITPNGRLADQTVVIVNGRIQSILPANHQPPPPAHVQRINATGLTLAPGLIDLQLNGAFGHDFTQNPATIWPVAAGLPQWGVTSFLPTIITAPLTVSAQAQQVLAQRPSTFCGAEPLGLHLEGPFLNPQKKGAHNPQHIQLPTPEAIANWSPQSGVRLVTLAPEMTGALPVIAALAERGVIVSAGHSMASFAQAQAGFAAGVRYGTHLYNAMPPLHHREPGLIGALLDDPHVTVGIIPDGVHVHPALIKQAWRLLGPRLNIVTDAMAALGMSPGAYELGDYTVTVNETTAQLPDGTLAGSIVRPDTAVRNFITYTGCTLPQAITAFSSTPARLLGLPHKGHIAPGCDADLVLFDATLHVHTTIIQGELVYSRDA